jgi:hypothetical protein
MSVGVRLADNLTGLTGHYFHIQGYKIKPAT